MAIKENIKKHLSDIDKLQFGNEAETNRILLRSKKLIRDLPRNADIYSRQLDTISFHSNIIRDVWSDNQDYNNYLDRSAWEKGKKNLVVLFEEILRDVEESGEVNQRDAVIGKEQTSIGDIDKIITKVISNFSHDIKGPIIEELLLNLKKELKADNPNKELIRQNANIILRHGTDKPDVFDELMPFIEPFLK